MEKGSRKSKNCATPYCRNSARQGQNFCGTCVTAKWRRHNPMMAAYVTLRYNATRRGKPFTITFDDFKEFCYLTNYMAGRGRSKTSYTIDCIINALGYVPGNLQQLSKSANSSKKDRILVYDFSTKYARVI